MYKASEVAPEGGSWVDVAQWVNKNGTWGLK